MTKNHDLPPPVTPRSSKKELWEELCAARDEIDSQQRSLNEARKENETLRRNLAAAASARVAPEQWQALIDAAERLGEARGRYEERAKRLGLSA
jgi:hypothetical protein